MRGLLVEIFDFKPMLPREHVSSDSKENFPNTFSPSEQFILASTGDYRQGLLIKMIN